VSTRETTAASGRKVANIVIDVLRNFQTSPEKSFLLSCQEKWAANHIATVVSEAVRTLWIFFIWFVRLLALRPLLAYCASLG
jgi:hypothetical protein